MYMDRLWVWHSTLNRPTLTGPPETNQHLDHRAANSEKEAIFARGYFREKIFSREDIFAGRYFRVNSIFAKISSRENISNSLFAKFPSRENKVLYSTPSTHHSTRPRTRPAR